MFYDEAPLRGFSPGQKSVIAYNLTPSDGKGSKRKAKKEDRGFTSCARYIHFVRET